MTLQFFNFCCSRALSYTTLDKLCFYIIVVVVVAVVAVW